MRYTKALTLAFITLVEARSNLRYRGKNSLQKDGINSATRTARTLEHDHNIFIQEESPVDQWIAVKENPEEDVSLVLEGKGAGRAGKGAGKGSKEGKIGKEGKKGKENKEGKGSDAVEDFKGDKDDAVEDFKNEKDRPPRPSGKGGDKDEPQDNEEQSTEKGDNETNPAPPPRDDIEDKVLQDIKAEGGLNGQGNCC